MGLDIGKVIIGMLLFSGIIVLGVSFIGDFNTNYGTTASPQFTSTYNIINQTNDIVGKQRDALSGANSTDTSTFTAIAKAAGQTFRLTILTIPLMISVLQDVAGTIGIPDYFVTIAIAIFTVSIVFAALLAFKGYQGGTP